MPYVEIVMLNVQFAQDEILLWTRLSKISSYLFRSGRDFLVLTFTGWHYWSRRPIMDESGVWTFSSIINYILYLSLNSKKVLRLTLSLYATTATKIKKLSGGSAQAFLVPKPSLKMILLSHVSVEGIRRKAWLVVVKFHDMTLWIWVKLPVEAKNPMNMYSLKNGERSRGCLVSILKHIFSVFKQYYTYFHTLFHSHVYKKKYK